MTKATAWLLLALLMTDYVHATETLRWQRVPLVVRLVVGQERVIILDRNVRVGSPTESAAALKIQSAAGAIYITPRMPLSSTRLQLQDIDDGSIILLDVFAESAQPNEPAPGPLRITTAPDDYGVDGSPAANGEHSVGSASPPTRVSPTPVPIVLTRYAAQSLYAPLRTVEDVTAISAVSVNRASALKSLLPTAAIVATPLAAWRLQNYWVTAVLLRNASATRIDLDPRNLQGDFITATFQHPDLGPAGDTTDTTVVYLVTRGRELRESLLPSISPFSGGDHHAQ